MRSILAVAFLAGAATALSAEGSSPSRAEAIAAMRARAIIEQPSLFNSSAALRRDGTVSPVKNQGLLSKRQADQTCGPDNGGRKCEGQRCCSFYGYCGTQEGYCSEFFCLPEFGWCTGQPIPSSSAPAPPPSSSTTAAPPPSSTAAPPASSSSAAPPAAGDGRCGPDNNGQVCPGQTCCSMYGYCGTGVEYCDPFRCLLEFGWCEGQPIPTSAPAPPPSSSSTAAPPPPPSSSTAAPSSSSAPATTPTPVTENPPQTDLTVSEDGRCGNSTGCEGSSFGNCCSKYYFCGGTEDYCMDDCRSDLGLCGEEAMPQPEPEYPPISLNGMCGNGTSCLGSGFGDCCSYYYYCGYGLDYCGDNCRKDSGVCYG